MDKFIVLAVTKERVTANRACAALEDAGIPVMIEHEAVSSENVDEGGFKVLVPTQFTQAAMKLTSAHSALFMTSSNKVQ